MFWCANRPDSDKEEDYIKPQKTHIVDAINYILKLKYESKVEEQRKTTHTFESNAKMFLEFCKEKGLYH